MYGFAEFLSYLIIFFFKSFQKLFCHRNESILKSLLTPNEIKCMIRLWISQERQPHSSDIHILEHYFCDLVHDKNIEYLNVLLKFFRR